MTYHFPKKILGNRISLTYKSLRKTLQKTYEVSKIRPQNSSIILPLILQQVITSSKCCRGLHGYKPISSYTDGL